MPWCMVIGRPRLGPFIPFLSSTTRQRSYHEKRGSALCNFAQLLGWTAIFASVPTYTQQAHGLETLVHTIIPHLPGIPVPLKNVFESILIPCDPSCFDLFFLVFWCSSWHLTIALMMSFVVLAWICVHVVVVKSHYYELCVVHHPKSLEKKHQGLTYAWYTTMYTQKRREKSEKKTRREKTKSEVVR